MIKKLKSKIKSILVPIFIAIILGFSSGKIIYHIYDNKITDVLNSSVIYILESGSYMNYDDMRNDNLINDYIYYKDKGKYNTIVGITKNENNISKISNLYNKDIIINKYFLDDKTLDSKITYYDNEIINEEDNDKIKTIVGEMIKYYKEKDISLTKVY